MEAATADDTIDDDDAIDGEDEPFIQEADDCPIAAQVSLLQSYLPYLQPDTHVQGMSGRVKYAYDMMHIAVCERIARMARSDTEGGTDASSGD